MRMHSTQFSNLDYCGLDRFRQPFQQQTAIRQDVCLLWDYLYILVFTLLSINRYKPFVQVQRCTTAQMSVTIVILARLAMKFIEQRWRDLKREAQHTRLTKKI